MKVMQIQRYSKQIALEASEREMPKPGKREVLIQVQAAAVNPLDLLILHGDIRLIHSYRMPLVLGNECSGIIREAGEEVTSFQPGDHVYARLPMQQIGAFAQFVAVDASAVAKMPKGYPFAIAAAIPLAALTSYQAIMEGLQAKKGETILVTGGSGSLGQMLVPIAKALGMHVIVTGNDRARDIICSLGADRYLDYRKENYWECIEHVDHVIDTLGVKEFEKELSILKPGGTLLSLKGTPNKEFAQSMHYPWFQRSLFTIAGAKYNRLAKKKGCRYRFLFVRSDGEQLSTLTEIIEKQKIQPQIDDRVFTLEQAQEALAYAENGHTNGKVILKVE